MTVVIGSNTYTVYGDLDGADDYLNAASHADNWRASDDTTKSRALVTSTRILDRQNWKEDYDTFAEREAVTDIVNAAYELANYIVDGVDVQNDQNISQKIQALKAGSVSITYFRGAEGSALRFPLIIMELIKDYLAGFGANLTGVATGTGGSSITNNNYGYNEGI